MLRLHRMRIAAVGVGCLIFPSTAPAQQGDQLLALLAKCSSMGSEGLMRGTWQNLARRASGTVWLQVKHDGGRYVVKTKSDGGNPALTEVNHFEARGNELKWRSVMGQWSATFDRATGTLKGSGTAGVAGTPVALSYDLSYCTR